MKRVMSLAAITLMALTGQAKADFFFGATLYFADDLSVATTPTSDAVTVHFGDDGMAFGVRPDPVNYPDVVVLPISAASDAGTDLFGDPDWRPSALYPTPEDGEYDPYCAVVYNPPYDY
jgi:hypothetical protein